MTDKEFIEVFKSVEKEAARYKKRNTPDWLELTEIGFSSIKENNSIMFDWCHAFRCARMAIVAKKQKWHDVGYKEPESLTVKICKGEFGLEYEEAEISNLNRIHENVIRKCIICGANIYKTNQITCSNKCQQRKAYLKRIKK